MNKLSHVLLAAAVLALALTIPLAQHGANRAPANDGLNSTLYVQSAAEYRAACMQAYALARLNLERAHLDSDWTAAIEQGDDYQAKKPAVILDVDETVLNNSDYQGWTVHAGTAFGSATWNQWCEQRKAEAIAGAVVFCKYAHKKGVTVFYLTNRDAKVGEATRDNLKALGFPFSDEVDTMRPRTDTSDKSPRRADICKDYRVLLLVGDAGGDFTSELDTGSAWQRRQTAEKYADWWGQRWIILPNPMYGKWESTLYDNDYGLSVAEKRQFKLAGLRYANIDAPSAKTVDESTLNPLLKSGPMPAYADMTGAAIWLQTTQPATVELRYWVETRPEEEWSANAETSKAGDCIAVFRLGELDFGTTYAYSVSINGKPVELPYALRFRTQPHWKWRMDPPDFSFTFGSCMYINEPAFDRPGKPYGGDFELLEALADDPAEFMLWLGDNTYTREPDWSSESGIRYRYAHTRAFPQLQRLLATRQNYAIWDDHDYGPNDADRAYAFKEESLRVFEDYWPAHRYGAPGAPGAFQRFEWGDVEVFTLDDRWYRSPNKAPLDDDKTMFGKAQLQWLFDGLTNSVATFKLIACGGQVLNPLHFYEGLGSIPAEQKRIQDFIVEHKIEGVVFLSGDRHHSELLSVTPEGGYPLYEYTCSPLTAGAGGDKREADNPARVGGTWVTGKRNYGKVTVKGKTGDRRLVLECKDKQGELLWTHEIKRSELSFN